MIRVLLYSLVSIIMLAFLLVDSAGAEVFNVSAVEDLQPTLSTAAANGEDDTINVAAGTYEVAETLTFFMGEGAFSLTIQGAGAGTTILDGGSSVQIMSLSGFGGTIFVRGLTFQNGNSTTAAGGGLEVNSSSEVIIENCEFLNNATTFYQGGGLSASGNSVTVNNNTFTGNGDNDTYGAGGAEVSGGTVTVTGNIFSGNTGGVAGGLELGPSGIARIASITGNIFSGNRGGFHGGGASLQGSGTYKVANNVFFNNICNSGGVGDGDGLYADNFGTLNLTNNTFLDNGEDMVLRLFNTDTANVYNNLVWSSAFGTGQIVVKEAVFFDDVFTFANVFNNDAQHISVTLENMDNFASGGNINADPLFVDQTNGDVHLQNGSPAINAGKNNAPDLPATDFEGNTRILAGTVDIGADEFTPSVIGKGMPWIPLLLLHD